MSTNIRQFLVNLDRYATEEMPGVVHDRVAAVALEGGRGLAETTPVDQGRAKGNWQTALREPPEAEIDRLDNSPEGSSAASPLLGEVADVMDDWSPGDTVWFGNGLDYVRHLNDGVQPHFRIYRGRLIQHRGNRAHHMLERTVARLDRWLAAS